MILDDDRTIKVVRIDNDDVNRRIRLVINEGMISEDDYVELIDNYSLDILDIVCKKVVFATKVGVDNDTKIAIYKEVANLMLSIKVKVIFADKVVIEDYR